MSVRIHPKHAPTRERKSLDGSTLLPLSEYAICNKGIYEAQKDDVRRKFSDERI